MRRFFQPLFAATMILGLSAATAYAHHSYMVAAYPVQTVRYVPAYARYRAVPVYPVPFYTTPVYAAPVYYYPAQPAPMMAPPIMTVPTFAPPAAGVPTLAPPVPPVVVTSY
jgi:hypothetical protein